MHKFVLPLAAVAFAGALTTADAQERVVADTPCELAIASVQEYITAEAPTLAETSRTRATQWLSRAAGAETQEICFRYVERAAGFVGYETEFDYADWENIRMQKMGMQ